VHLGVVNELWRFPVKSMMGERLSSVTVTEMGVLGDRGWATRDEVRGGIRGAKKIGPLMTLSARYRVPPTADTPTPHVDITLPDGSVVATDDPDVDAVVSDALGHPVTLHALRPPTEADHYRRGAPDHEDLLDELRSIFGRTDNEPLPDLAGFPPELVGQLMEFESPPGTYYDAFPLLLVTDASLRSLAALAPDSSFDVRRFRPNVFVSMPDGNDGHAGADADQFPEQQWLGRRVRIGEVVVEVTAPCPRCVMVTRGFAELPDDRSVLRTVVREAAQNVGVYATVVTPGEIALDDAVEVEG
jgi:uncharacterized protein